MTTLAGTSLVDEFPTFASLQSRVDASALQTCDDLERDAGLMPLCDEKRKLSMISTDLTNETLLPRLVLNVNIDSTKHGIFATTSDDSHLDISPESLSQKLHIGLETAKKPLNELHNRESDLQSILSPPTTAQICALPSINYSEPPSTQTKSQ